MDQMTRNRLYDLYKGTVYPGWWPILDKYVPELLAIDPDCDFYIKEKYGYLRLGVRSPILDWDRVIEIENAAELASSTVCEFCGSPGFCRSERRWMQTLCDRCATADRETMYKVIEEAEQRWMAMQEESNESKELSADN